jgi:hypothetical protein
MEIYPLSQVINTTTVTSGNFFNTNSVVVYYSMAQILSYLSRPEWLMLSIPLLFASFGGKIFSLRTPQRKYSYGFKSGLFGRLFRPHAKRSGNRFEMTRESKLSKTTFAVWGLAPSCMNHWVCNGKPVQEGEAQKYCTACLNSAHCSLSLQRKLALAVHDLRWRHLCNSRYMMHPLMNHTKPPLCDHNTSCKVHCFYALFYRESYFVSHSCVDWRMSRNSATLARSGRVRTNLHGLL